MSALRASDEYERRLTEGTEFRFIPATPEEFVFGAEFMKGGDLLDGRPSIFPSVAEDFIAFQESEFNEAVFCEAIGSGKSYLAALILAYDAHLLGCLRNPQAKLGFSKGSMLALMNMSISAPQARDVVFGVTKGMVDGSLWFQRHFNYDPRTTSRLLFPHGIVIIPGNSRESKPIGYNIVSAILDEASHFTDTQDRPVAEEIYLAMERRMRSRLKRAAWASPFDPKAKWRWKLAAISSPRYEEDFTEVKMRDPDAFRRRRAIWESRPFDYKGEPMVAWEGQKDPATGEFYMVPSSMLSIARKNPTKFKRDFMAVACSVLEPYYVDPLLIDACEDGRLCVVEDGGPIPNSLKAPAFPCAFHIDLAKTRDACAVAIGHREGRDIVYDLLWRIVPTKGQEVNFAAVREAILALRGRGFKFFKGSYDGWQSVDSIQLLAAKGIEMEMLSVDRDLQPHDTLHEAVNEGRARWGVSKTLARELKTLELIKGRKVDHPPKGSKDVADAAAGVAFHLRSEAPSVPQSVLIGRTGARKGARVARQGTVAGRYGRSPY